MTINNTLDLYKGPLPRYSHNSFCLTVFVEKKLEIRDRCRSLEKKDCFFSTLPRTAPGCLGFRPTSFFSDFSELKNLEKKDCFFSTLPRTASWGFIPQVFFQIFSE